MKSIYLQIRIFSLTLIALLLAGCAAKPGGGKWHHDDREDIMEAREKVSSSYVESNKIALMLPLKGKFAAKSKAIRNGFLAAFYQARKKRPNLSVKIFDTTGEDVGVLYQKAIESGAGVVVGPLTKMQVERMSELGSLPIPVIALNTLDDYTSNYGSNLYQFGLLPQDEATQVATKMISDNSDQVAIIYPDNTWGEKIVETFKNKYESSGGEVKAALSYSSKANLAEQVCYFLAQDPEELCVRKKKKRKDKNKDKEREHDQEDGDEEKGKEGPDTSENMRRQDINSIFLVANERDAHQLVPLLKFYYAGDLSIYSTSSVYSGTRNPNRDRDLDGVRFCDMPWVLKQPGSLGFKLNAIRSQIITLWSDSFSSYSKLYALGVDAYMLASGLNKFLDSSGDGLDGASGKLYLDNYNHIYRQLRWAKMRNGVPVLIRSPKY